MTVFFNKQRHEWQAKVWVHGEYIDLGCYPNEYEANIMFASEIEKYKVETPKVRVYSPEWFDKESRRQRIELSNKYQ